jgi:hypothetical protein
LIQAVNGTVNDQMEPLPTSIPTPVELFMERIAKIETPGSDNYTAVNQYGMLGKYQFSPNTISYLGYDVSDEDFSDTGPSL